MKTECCVVQDLLPLYIENMVSPETRIYVEEHLAFCAECRSELEYLTEGGQIPTVDVVQIKESESVKPFRRIMKRLRARFYMLAYSLIIFFIFLGFAWTGGENLMYNSLIMPVVGIFGYYVFGWKAVYKMPLLLLVIDLAVFAFQLVEIGFADTLNWTGLYSIFVLIGVAIAFLLHFAFKKEDKTE